MTDPKDSTAVPTALRRVYRNVGTDPDAILAFLREACELGYGIVVVAPDVHDAVVLRPRPGGAGGVAYQRDPFIPSGHALALPPDPLQLRGDPVSGGRRVPRWVDDVPGV